MERIMFDAIRKELRDFQIEECPSVIITVPYCKVKELMKAYEKYEIPEHMRDDAVFLAFVREDIIFPDSRCVSVYYQLSDSIFTLSLINVLIGPDDERTVEQVITDTIKNSIDSDELKWEWIVKSAYEK